MTLGQKIASSRIAIGLNQSDLAEKVGVEPPTVSRWENDKIIPRPRRLVSIAEIVGKPVQWFQPHDSKDLALVMERLDLIEKDLEHEIQHLRTENDLLKARVDNQDSSSLTSPRDKPG